LNEEDQHRLGNFGKVNPPLRSKSDQEALWRLFAIVDTIGTDHAPHTLDEKNQPYNKAPSGMPGVQTMLPLLLTAASEGKLTLQDIVQRCVINPVRIFRLRDKGALEVGKHADIVLIDPEQSYEITNEEILSKCGWTPFAGTRVKGKIQQVYLRGTLAYDHDTVLAQPGTGQPLSYL
jgi:dihydroorotase